jgi:hypothetical protein
VQLNIECEFFVGSRLDEFGFLHTSYVKNVTFTGSKSLETMTGNHINGNNTADVQQIIFGFINTCNDLDYVPHA